MTDKPTPLSPARRNAERVRSAVQSAGGLYNLTGLAAFFGVTREGARRWITKPDFPVGITIEGGERTLVWSLDEVVEWREARNGS